jgi:hypothetical protein
MRRFKVTMVAIAALALLLATNAMAADPTVDSVLAIEYDNGVFAAAVLAHGPAPLALARLFVNDVEVIADKDGHVVLLPAKNLTLFKFTKFGPDAVIKAGDVVTAEVTDINNHTAEKSVNCVQSRIFHQLVVCR